MFSVITNIYNKKTKGSTLMDLFTATGKLKKFFLTTRKIVVTHTDACVTTTLISYRCVPCHPWCTHRTFLVVKKKKSFSCGCEQFHYGRSFGFLVINVYNHGVHYETPCINETYNCHRNTSTAHTCVHDAIDAMSHIVFLETLAFLPVIRQFI
jgi:hypothetical protein